MLHQRLPIPHYDAPHVEGDRAAVRLHRQLQIVRTVGKLQRVKGKAARQNPAFEHDDLRMVFECPDQL